MGCKPVVPNYKEVPPTYHLPSYVSGEVGGGGGDTQAGGALVELEERWALSVGGRGEKRGDKGFQSYI